MVLGLATWVNLEIINPDGLMPPQLAGLLVLHASDAKEANPEHPLLAQTATLGTRDDAGAEARLAEVAAQFDRWNAVMGSFMRYIGR